MRIRCLVRTRIALFALVCPLSLPAADNLVINELTRNPAVVVYELPDADGREDAVRFVEKIRNRFWGGAELLDAATASETTLRQKFQQRCVLYTTLGEKSRLVRLATPGMGWEVRDGMFRWQDVAIPLAETRFILAARNPYADGYFAVYAGGSNLAVVNINAVSHGPASFHVFRGATLWKEGFYGANLSPRDRISKAEAVEDVGQFFTTLERVHPNLLAKIGKAEYRRLRQWTLQELTLKLNANEQVAIEDLAWILYYAAARFQDGHTSVRWYTTPTVLNSAGRRFPAFRLGFDNGRFVVVAADDKANERAEVVAINGAPVREFLRPILERCSGETLVSRAAAFTQFQSFWFYFANLFGGAEPVRLTLRSASGEREWTAATLDAAGYLAFTARARTATPRPQSGTSVEFLADGSIAHFQYQSFVFSDAEKKKIDEIFRRIREKGSRDLIIDLRGNGGGHSAMGDYIFRHIYDDKFRQYSAEYVKISPEIRKTAEELANAEDGKVVKRSPRETSLPKPEAFFAGRKYLLIDNGTFSSAASFATMFRDYQVGTILGYETGGLPVHFGDVYSFRLKNSDIPCGVSWKQFFGPKPREGDDRHGVLPDVPMNEESLARFRTQPDPVLAATVRYILDRR